jgi:hypothetical protein
MWRPFHEICDTRTMKLEEVVTYQMICSLREFRDYPNALTPFLQLENSGTVAGLLPPWMRTRVKDGCRDRWTCSSCTTGF